jgi:hypothetical protein
VEYTDSLEFEACLVFENVSDVLIRFFGFWFLFACVSRGNFMYEGFLLDF